MIRFDQEIFEPCVEGTVPNAKNASFGGGRNSKNHKAHLNLFRAAHSDGKVYLAHAF